MDQGICKGNTLELLTFSTKLWNSLYRTTRKTRRKQRMRIRELRRKYTPEIFFLSETKNPDEVVIKELEDLQYNQIKLVSPHSPGGGGLALLWTEEVKLEVLQESQNYIDTQITFKGKKFYAIFIYGDPDKDKRKPVWDALTEIASLREGPWFQIGSDHRPVMAYFAARKKKEKRMFRYDRTKYCRNRPFMEVSPRPSSSHGWKGLLAGRDLLKQGMGIAIGDGKSTNVWRDPWTALIAPGITTGPAPLQQANLMIADLIDVNTKEWNVEMLKNLFPTIWTGIRQLRPSKSKAPDKPIWMHTKDGIYSTRSGYYKAMENRIDEQIETNSQGFTWKKEIWNIKCPPKIHMLLWRVVRGTLPVGTNLLRRKVTTTACCSRCGDEETEMHLLFHCPYARKVWSLAPLQAPLNVQSITDLRSGLAICNKLQQTPPTTMNRAVSAPWIMWALWSSRNKKIFDKRTIPEAETIQLAMSSEEEWKKAQKETELTTTTVRTQRTSIRPSTRQETEQEDLPSSSLICQTDAAWHDQSKNAGLGWVVLNRAREVKSRNCKPVPYIKSSCEAEALCILEAILSLQNHHQDKIIIESDSKVVITAINTRKSPINMIGVIEDILNFAKPFHSISFRYIPRSENTCADDLAKTAIRSMTLGQSTSL
ncbi:unnamed protein product [Arabidopsis halleri]